MAARSGAIHATTILAVRRGGMTAMGGDGQVTNDTTVLKSTAVKIRQLQDGRVLAGFAGAVADALALFDRFEGKLKEYNNLKKAAVELAKEWRTDRYLRRLEAMLVVADASFLLLISGTGEVIEPDTGTDSGDSCIAVGSGGNYALAAAQALLSHSELDARAIVEEALGIAGELCIYTNANITVDVVSKE